MTDDNSSRFLFPQDQVGSEQQAVAETSEEEHNKAEQAVAETSEEERNKAEHPPASYGWYSDGGRN